MSHLCAQIRGFTVTLKALYFGRRGKPYFAHCTKNHFILFWIYILKIATELVQKLGSYERLKIVTCMFGVSEKNMLQEPLHSRTAGTERVNFFVRDEWRIGVTRLCAVRQSTQKLGCALNSPRHENQDSATEEGSNEKLTLPLLLQTPPSPPFPPPTFRPLTENDY